MTFIFYHGNIKLIHLLFHFSKPDAYTQPFTVKKQLNGYVMAFA